MPALVAPRSARSEKIPGIKQSSLQETSLAYFKKTYKVVKKLGGGGFGKVYGAKRRADQLQVAVKEVPRNKVEDWIVKNGKF